MGIDVLTVKSAEEQAFVVGMLGMLDGKALDRVWLGLVPQRGPDVTVDATSRGLRWVGQGDGNAVNYTKWDM